MTAQLLPLHAETPSFYTGKPPVHGLCPGVGLDGIIRSLPQVNCNASRKEMLDYFDNTWTLTEVLFSGLASDEAYYVRPYHQLRHPMIFYYGHPVTLYVNKLRVAGLLTAPVNPAFEQLFETGVDEMRRDDLHEGNQEVWPSVAEVRKYRRTVYNIIKNLIETHPLLEPQHLPITQASQMWALVMGFEHERIHLETSSVQMREMPVQHLRKPKEWPALGVGGNAGENAMRHLPAQSVKLGKPADFPSFGWDNEYGAETRSVRPFSASEKLISNAEFLEFVKDGGYTNEAFWSREGWAWRRFRNVKWPTFWVQNGPAGLHDYRLRTVFEVVDMQPSWPAIVNFWEAKAYCAWKTAKENSSAPYRLLTEAEHAAIRTAPQPSDNLGLQAGSERSVSASAANSKGFHDAFGNVWQWLEDHFHPLEGAKPHPYYDDFSLPCYDGEHQMILGGSFISTGDEASAFARFHFRPHFFQHAGFRVARSEDGNTASDAKIISKSDILTLQTVDFAYKQVLQIREAVLKKPDFIGVTDDVLKNDESSIHFAYKINDKMLGCVSLKMTGIIGILRQMAVLPEVQTSGIGRKLVAALEAHACVNGVQKIEVEARSTATYFYKKLGYRTIGRFYTKEDLEHIMMCKELG